MCSRATAILHTDDNSNESLNSSKCQMCSRCDVFDVFLIKCELTCGTGLLEASNERYKWNETNETKQMQLLDLQIKIYCHAFSVGLFYCMHFSFLICCELAVPLTPLILISELYDTRNTMHRWNTISSIFSLNKYFRFHFNTENFQCVNINFSEKTSDIEWCSRTSLVFTW